MVIEMLRVRTLTGEVKDVLGPCEVEIEGRRVMKIKKWFCEKNKDVIDKLKKCRIEKETDKAVLIMNDNEMLWIPKSVIIDITEY